MLRSSARCLAVALIAAPALAGTWTVDDDGGVGVDFTDIAPAIAAASAGDVLLVLPGTYSGFVLSKPLSIMASPGALLDGAFTTKVFNLPAGTSATIRGLFLTSGDTIWVQDCSGTVVLDELQASQAGLQVSGSADVRLRGSRSTS